MQVTFEEVRRHLGVETQRQWSALAIARTTPALLALFALVTLLVDRSRLLEANTQDRLCASIECTSVCL